MKISISTQKKIMWIPIINIFSIYIWLYNYICYPNKSAKLWWGAIGYTLAHMIPAIIISVVLTYWFSEASVLHMITIYLCPLSMSYALVHWQEKNM